MRQRLDRACSAMSACSLTAVYSIATRSKERDAIQKVLFGSRRDAAQSPNPKINPKPFPSLGTDVKE